MTKTGFTGDHFMDDIDKFQFNPDNVLLYHVMLSPVGGSLLEGNVKRELEEHLRDALFLRRGCRIEDYLVMPDHLHLVILIFPMHSVQDVVRDIQERTPLWSPSYRVSVLKNDEEIKLREWHDNSIKTEFAPRLLEYYQCGA